MQFISRMVVHRFYLGVDVNSEEDIAEALIIALRCQCASRYLKYPGDYVAINCVHLFLDGTHPVAKWIWVEPVPIPFLINFGARENETDRPQL